MINDLLQAGYGLRGDVSRLAGAGDNFLVATSDSRRYVLKFCGDDQTSDFLELEYQASEAAAAALPDIAFPRVVRTNDGNIEATYGAGDEPVRARLLNFIEGTPWGDACPSTPELRQQFGRLLARLTSALANIDHPAALISHDWDLTAAAAHRHKVALMADPAHRRLLEQAFLLFVANADPVLAQLPPTLIHGDLNGENILVNDQGIAGFLDFGDALANPAICELAIALAYAMLDEPDPLAAGAEIVAAYHAERPLSAIELEILFPLICGRLAMSLAIAAENHQAGETRPALFVTEEPAWRALAQYMAFDPLMVADQLAAQTGVAVFTDRVLSMEEVLPRRHQRISAALSLTFDRPLKLSRGRAQFLYDERERPYLDLYNNVAHVGHSHPRVVAAGARQMARLNTNSRYVYDQMAEFADKLCATLPPELEQVFFVNSGTEANELALRLARTFTGHYDMVVLDAAYHGNSNTMIDISPYKFAGPGGTGARPWVQVVEIPDGYRGRFKGQSRETGRAYGNAAGEVIAAAGRPLAGFIAESLPSVGGQIIPPEGYLKTVYGHVRAAGGVCIADEVHVGFGRVGSHFWGFELQDMVPDIVAMGKPIGNGHPLGAVATTRAIADAFADTGMEYFSTFGGNPVSCAIGSAVLDVIRDEDLQANAQHVGPYLRDGLSELMDRHSLVGDVRGAGLFIGVELVRDRETLEPAAEEAALLVDELRRHGILTGTDGPYHNVVKIKPPMVVTREDAAMAIRVFDDILSTTLGGNR